MESAYEELVGNDRIFTDLHKDCCKVLSKINMQMACELVKRANKINPTAKRIFLEAYRLIKESSEWVHYNVIY